MPLLPPPPEQQVGPQTTESFDHPAWQRAADTADYLYQKIFSSPDKFGNLGKQPTKPVQPISTSDIMSPETESLLRNGSFFERAGVLGNSAYEAIAGKPAFQTLDAGQGNIPRYQTIQPTIGMAAFGPEFNKALETFTSAQKEHALIDEAIRTKYGNNESQWPSRVYDRWYNAYIEKTQAASKLQQVKSDSGAPLFSPDVAIKTTEPFGGYFVDPAGDYHNLVYPNTHEQALLKSKMIPTTREFGMSETAQALKNNQLIRVHELPNYMNAEMAHKPNAAQMDSLTERMARQPNKTIIMDLWKGSNGQIPPKYQPFSSKNAEDALDKIRNFYK